jgi:accessory gene regulator protein AgrB
MNKDKRNFYYMLKLFAFILLLITIYGESYYVNHNNDSASKQKYIKYIGITFCLLLLMIIFYVHIMTNNINYNSLLVQLGCIILVAIIVLTYTPSHNKPHYINYIIISIILFLMFIQGIVSFLYDPRVV